MLHSLFRISTLQAGKRKRAERAASKFVGRTKVPGADEREAIVTGWEAIKYREPDLRQCYQGHTRASLQQVIEKSEKDERSRKEFVDISPA